MLDVQLSPGIAGGKWARLRPLCGHDENRIDAPSAVDAIAFVDALLTETSGTTVKPGRAADLTVSDFDRLCASVYVDCFGEVIAGRIVCRTCRESFEMQFSLKSLMQNLAERSADVHGPDEHGIYTSSEGLRFRLPTAGDKRDVSALKVDLAIAALLERCAVDPAMDSAAGPNGIEKSMEQAGPVLDLDLDAACPHCGVTQAVRFDIQSYLFRALSYEKRFLLYEVHRIAAAYRWTHQEILALSRTDRRRLVGLIESERTAQRRHG